MSSAVARTPEGTLDWQTSNFADNGVMEVLPRIVEPRLRQALQRGKSVLLLGPRQTGPPLVWIAWAMAR